MKALFSEVRKDSRALQRMSSSRLKEAYCSTHKDRMSMPIARRIAQEVLHTLAGRWVARGGRYGGWGEGRAGAGGCLNIALTMSCVLVEKWRVDGQQYKVGGMGGSGKLVGMVAR